MPRKYNSPRRRAQAGQTRVAIIEAAFRLFLENGYSDTSIKAVAEAAGVAERTVYLAFDDKPSLLAAIADHAVYGGTKAGEGETQFVEQLGSIESPAERLRLSIRQAADGFEQGLAALGRIVSGAALGDDRLKDFVADVVRYRHEATREFAAAIVGRPIPREPRFERMIDELEVASSDEVFWILVMDRAWPRQEYEDHVFATVSEILGRNGFELE